MSENTVSSLNFSVKEEIKCEKVEYYETGIKIEKFDSTETDSKPEAGPSYAVKMEGFLCGFCGKHFFYEEFFTEHIQDHHSPPTSSIQAGNSSTTEDMLQQEAEQTEEPVEDDVLTEDENCDTFCEITAPGNNENVKPAHNVGVKKARSTADKGKKRKLTLQKQNKDSGERPFRCCECEFMKRSFHHLKHHMMKHSGDYPFKCTECSYATVHYRYLVRHNKTHTAIEHTRIYTGESSFKCSVCEYSCKHRRSLTRHMMKHGLDGEFEYYYNCSACDFKCLKHHDFKQHIISEHNGKRPYSCLHCDYRCKSKQQLQTHSMKNTCTSSGAVFKCRKCTYTAFSKSVMLEHTILDH